MDSQYVIGTVFQFGKIKVLGKGGGDNCTTK